MTIDDTDQSGPCDGSPKEVTDSCSAQPDDDDRFNLESALVDPKRIEESLAVADGIATELATLVDERTVTVQKAIDEDEFFSTTHGNTTVSNRYDLEKAVPLEKKSHFHEIDRYWVNKPYAFVSIFHSATENERKYYLIEPHLNELEADVRDFLSGKLRTTIKYAEEDVEQSTQDRRTVIEEEARTLLDRYDLLERNAGRSDTGLVETITSLFRDETTDETGGPHRLDGIEVRPEPVVLAEDPETLNEYQAEKLLYQLTRNFVGYERIDGIKRDSNVEDISVDGYTAPVFVHHSEHEQLISNIHHGEDELDEFVVKLAQRSGNGISKRRPQVDATLPDGSRAQLTLGTEVSDHGTNYTIRQFKDVPFTPIDLINWKTFSLEAMAFLWLAIENHRSILFAGGTASGKTTSLNAVSLFIPSNAKIVSIEDTREVALPQRNWIASTTRPSFSTDSTGDVDEFDLLEAALRQRPDYIVMGEVRGEEGRTLFQVMSTGHTTSTTFHADSVDEVLKRFTTAPIDVSKTMFTALDLVSVQTQTRVQGRTVRRNTGLTEINQYDTERDEINVQDVYQWQPETDDHLKIGDSNTLDDIRFDRGWSRETLEEELFKRRVILAYLIKNELNTYAEVAATVQAFNNDPDSVLTLLANGRLEASLENLREMESVSIDDDVEAEEHVQRPDPSAETDTLSSEILERAEESLFDEYRTESANALASVGQQTDELPRSNVESGTAAEYGHGGSTAGETREDGSRPEVIDPKGDAHVNFDSHVNSDRTARDECVDDGSEGPALEVPDAGETAPDTSAFGALFPGRELDSIFESDSPAAGDSSSRNRTERESIAEYPADQSQEPAEERT